MCALSAVCSSIDWVLKAAGLAHLLSMTHSDINNITVYTGQYTHFVKLFVNELILFRLECACY